VTRNRQPAAPASDPPFDAERKLRELEFLHEFAKLLTTARNWDELMRTIVDRTTTALDVEVCSVYLMERDVARLRLAATNGLDRDQIGLVTLAVGEGLTGHAAMIGRPVASPDVRVDPRFKWVPGFDQSQFVSMLSVPLPWNDSVIGVINLQAIETRVFSLEEVEFLVTIGALLGGIVEKGRLQAEAEEQLETLTALDGARAELLAVVTHELRTPLAVVRAYVDLLGDAAADAAGAPASDDRAGSAGPNPNTDLVEEWRAQAIAQVTRLDRLVDSILASVRVVPDQPATLEPVAVAELLADVVAELGPLAAQHTLELRPGVRLQLLADPARLRQMVEHLVENAVKYAPPGTRIGIDWAMVEGTIRIGVEDEGPGIPPEWRERIFEPYARRDTHTARGSGIGLYAAKRLAESMRGHLWCEPARGHGARFVISLPAVAAI
jgi:signal transduction histidine kinase